MTKKYNVCSRLEIEGREKPIWPPTGMTLTVRDDGRMTLFDGRTGMNYYLFEKEQRQPGTGIAGQQPPQQQAAPAPTPSGDFDDDIPF